MRPMLASTLKTEDFSSLRFPLYCTPKLDGIRYLKVDNRLLSRTLKQIPNEYIQTLCKSQPEFTDGEIIAGNFQETTSLVMSDYKEGHFTLYVFDYLKDPNLSYLERMEQLSKLECPTNDKFSVAKLLPVKISNVKELTEYEEKCLSEGYEGIMLRSPNGKYKYGRATPREQSLMKLKRFSDYEATIIGFEEHMTNLNESIPDEMGLLKKQTLKENKIGSNKLGSLVVEKDGIQFKVGSGFNDSLREQIWDNQERYLGKIIKFKTFEVTGVKEKPRFPIFLGFRDSRDM